MGVDQPRCSGNSLPAHRSTSPQTRQPRELSYPPVGGQDGSTTAKHQPPPPPQWNDNFVKFVRPSMTGECKSARLAWYDTKSDIESLVAKSDLSHTFRADAGTGATNRSPTTWRASRSHIRNWVATKTLKSRKGHANKNKREKCPKQGYIDVLLDLIRSYCRTSRTGSKSSEGSILSVDSWGGCVVKLSRFPAICCSRKPTTSSEDERYQVSPPFSEFALQMTSHRWTSLHRKMAAAYW